MTERLESVQIGVVDTETLTRRELGGPAAETWLEQHWPVSHPWDEAVGEAVAPEADRQTPAEQRGLAACLIDVCATKLFFHCPMGDCIACRERNAAWEALYRLLDPKYQEMIQRFLVFAELTPPGMPEEDR